MKDLRPIEIQVAELNEEQKNNIVMLYKKQFKILIIAMIVFAVVIVAFIGFRIAASIAKDDWDRIETSITLSGMDGSYDMGLFDANYDAMNRYYDLLQYSNLSLMIGGGLALIIGCISLIVLSNGKKQFPYYSEKKYRYIKKTRNTKSN